MNYTINSRKRAPLWVFAFQLIQEKIRKPHIRKAVADIISKFLPTSENKTIQGEKLYSKLKEVGYCEMPNIITTEEADELRDSLTNMICFDPWKPYLGKFNIEDAPKEVHTAQIENVLAIPRLLEIANNPIALEVCERYFGCKPIIDSIQAWWSLPGHEKAEQAENLHRDNDGIRFLKYFIYLTEVTEESGPHVFVEGSHLEPKGLDIRRYEDTEVEALFGKNKFRKFTGKKGLSFIEDTYGFHKGQPAKTEKRLLLQIRYALMPTIFLNKNYINNFEKKQEFDIYSNKFLVK
ncbi:hypothetical protein GCM10011514_30640 [Emticicia aquatilis]|uniref:Phytanoyl-CoA dioxygenase n=1 Tax=Emticicia aquatilis TaxID=1537369 RepID=A0A916YVX2_9BACT|nr:phytanoyl-CoA dioxygenase family protein [Emticicia aquatilis]GGD64519.1 hypothetical protein GCM10011514_30640 [Emticicia aquatilis]